jgi:hypothetical protein
MSTSSLPKVGIPSNVQVIVYYICHTCIKRHELPESTASIGDKDNNEDDDGDNNDHHATKKRKKLEVIEIDGDVLPSDIGGIELSQMSQMSGITSSPASARTGNSRTSDIARPPKKSKSNNGSRKKKRPAISDIDLEKQVNHVRDISGGRNIVDSSLRNIVDSNS